MGKYIVKRLLSLIPVLIGVSLIVFFLVRLIPGTALQMYMGTQVEATPAQLEELKRLFGEDRPIPVLYFEWMGNLLKGDFGHSLRTGRPVLPDILSRLPISLELTIYSLLLALIIGIPLGVLSSLRQNTTGDFINRIIGLIGLSFPNSGWQRSWSSAFHTQGWIPMGNYVPITKAPLVNLKMFFLPRLPSASALPPW